MMLSDKILVTGHKGLVGSALVRELKRRGFEHVIIWDRKDVDLRDPVAVKWAFSSYEPKYVFMAGAKVGGIKANMADQAGFLVDNWNMQQNVMINAHEHGTRKLLFLGSSCIYPEHAPNPITEDSLLSGKLQAANEGYALAKICGLKLGQYLRRQHGFDVISAMPCNLFGPEDNFNDETAHVIPGMMARMHRARENDDPIFKVWGSPTAQREFLFSDDLAKALLFLMDSYEDEEPINVGSDVELDMSQLAWRIAEAVGYEGKLEFTGQDVGTTRKKMSIAKLVGLGWNPRAATPFSIALQRTYESFLRILHDPSTPRHRVGARNLGLAVGPNSTLPGHGLS